MGRLRLSVSGCLEPRSGKCNDLRLFCILTKFDKTFLQQEKTPEIITMEAAMAKKIKKMKNFILFFVFLALSFFMIACNTESDLVTLVKNGSLFAYPNTTIGKAFDKSFSNTKWVAKESEKGIRFVEFTGDYSDEWTNSFIEFGVNPDDLFDNNGHVKPILVQFLFRANSDTMEVGFFGLADTPINSKSKGAMDLVDFLDLVYSDKMVKGSPFAAIFPQRKGFTDTRDGLAYCTRDVAGKEWMMSDVGYKKLAVECRSNGCEYAFVDLSKVCPEGWNVPTVADAILLNEYFDVYKNNGTSNYLRAIRAQMLFLSSEKYSNANLVWLQGKQNGMYQSVNLANGKIRLFDEKEYDSMNTLPHVRCVR